MRLRHNKNDDRGAVLVEFALTMPLLVMLLLGMFTGGFTFNQKLAIANGVREGSRYGATLSFTAAGSRPQWATKVADVTQNAAEGNISASAPNMSICVAYIGKDAADTFSLTRDSSGDHPGTGQCFDDLRPSGELRVQVVAQRNGSIEYVFGKATPLLKSQSATKFEASS